MNDGLAKVPPMGWNSWNKFGPEINETVVMETAEAMVKTGLAAAGYQYVVIDDCWMAPSRDPEGKLVPNLRKFPHGIKYVADYVHSLGLKFGIYSSCGVRTCQGLPGSLGYEAIDAHTFAGWGVDYLKYDFCYSEIASCEIDKITIDGVVYEAESDTNLLSGGARVGICRNCSGQRCVTGIDEHGGALQFNDIRVPRDGTYEMTITYVHRGGDVRPRALFIQVNGGADQRVRLINYTGQRDAVNSLQTKVQLRKGSNVILFHNPYTTREISILNYKCMTDALRATGRPIVFSICEWGTHSPWEWGAEIGHLWRTTGDITDAWQSVLSILDKQDGLERYSGPGHWNDPDMLEVGNGGMTDTEYRSHFALWCILAAPLMAGNDIRNMSESIQSILTNEELIAVDQDPLGEQGRRVRKDASSEVWVKRLSNGDRAVVLLNRGSAARALSVKPAELGLPVTDAYLVRDLWAHTSTMTAGAYTALVAGHGVAALRVRPGTADEAPPAISVKAEWESCYLLPGFGRTGMLTVANMGLQPLHNLQLDLRAPRDWSVSVSPGRVTRSLIPGEAVEFSFTLQPDVKAKQGAVDVPVVVTYDSPNGTGHNESYLTVVVPPRPPEATSYLSDLEWLAADNGYGPVERDRSNGEAAAGDGRPLRVNGVQYNKGLGVHAPSRVEYYLGRRCARFISLIGIDDETNGGGSVEFQVLVDGNLVFRSGTITPSSSPQPVDIDIRGAEVLTLVVTDAGDGNTLDHADWAEARVFSNEVANSSTAQSQHP